MNNGNHDLEQPVLIDGEPYEENSIGPGYSRYQRMMNKRYICGIVFLLFVICFFMYLLLRKNL